jgi:chemotaxis signal transduction protein
MSGPDGARLVTFEVGATVYGLPIGDVIEVAEVEGVSCVPTLPLSLLGVVNHHGDALPVVSRSVVFDADDDMLPAPRHLLVIGAEASDSARFGLPVDRVLGLVDAPARVPRSGAEIVSEHRPVDGRLVHVLSRPRLLARVVEAVGRTVDPAFGRVEARRGGES